MSIYTYISKEFKRKLNKATGVKKTIIAQIKDLSILNINMLEIL